MVTFPDIQVKIICGAFICMVNSVTGHRITDVTDRPLVILAAGKTIHERESPSDADSTRSQASLRSALLYSEDDVYLRKRRLGRVPSCDENQCDI